MNGQTGEHWAKGNGYVFISFNDTVFFRPNDIYDLLDEGKEVLDQVAQIHCGGGPLPSMRSGCLGHTAQAVPSQ